MKTFVFPLTAGRLQAAAFFQMHLTACLSRKDFGAIWLLSLWALITFLHATLRSCCTLQILKESSLEMRLERE